jgi:HSP20 family protein
MAEWNPWQGLDGLRREIDRAFEDFGFRSEPMLRSAFLPGRAARRYPLMNVHEDRDHVYVEAVAPGVDAESLNLTVVRNTLTISGEKRRIPGDIKPEAFHRSERSTGKFVRSIALPVEVNEDNIKAEYKNGLLLITLPKAEKARPKQISVSVA